MTALATFFASRAANAGYYCPCCKSVGLDADDMVLDARTWRADTIAAAAERYRAPICDACMDNHVWTQDGLWVLRDNAVKDAWGEWWSDEDQLDAALADAEADAAGRRMYDWARR